ncbi:MAG: ROK family protein [Candidatus Cloacimonetes bacterium]|nr:ROK family protein [Candidatus Cloacimonadota bacterium]
MDKKSNASMICQSLWQHPMESRAALAKRLSIDKATITGEITTLIKRNIVIEMPTSVSAQTGRRPIPLMLNGRSGMVIGLAIQAGSYSVVVVNMNDEVLFSASEKAEINSTNLIQMVHRIFDEITKSPNGPFPQCLGLSIGVGGLVNSIDRSIDFSVPLKYSSKTRIIEPLSKELGIDVLVENNANCCAWLNLLPVNKGPSDFIFLMIEFNQVNVPHKKFGGIGIGLGIVIGGRLYHGAHSYAGEFRSAFCNGEDDFQLSLSRNEMNSIFDDHAVFEHLCDELSRNIALLANSLDVGCIYVGSDCEPQGREFCRTLENAIHAGWPFPVEKRIPISYSAIGAYSVAIGAAREMYMYLFDNEMIPC